MTDQPILSNHHTATTARQWRAPGIIAWLFLAVTVVTLFSLSFWQLQRLEWKENIINTLASYRSTPALAQLPDVNTALNQPYARALLSGEFLHQHEIHLSPRYYNSQLGYHIITPMRLDDGRIVLVNRGWVHVDKKEKETRLDTLTEGTQHIVGMIRTDNNERHRFTPNNSPEENIWFWKDIPTIASTTNLDLLPYSVDQLYGPASSPIPSDGLISLRNDHLNYAITWALIGISAIVIFLIFHYQPIPVHTSQRKAKDVT